MSDSIHMNHGLALLRRIYRCLCKRAAAPAMREATRMPTAPGMPVSQGGHVYWADIAVVSLLNLLVLSQMHVYIYQTNNISVYINR